MWFVAPQNHQNSMDMASNRSFNCIDSLPQGPHYFFLQTTRTGVGIWHTTFRINNNVRYWEIPVITVDSN